MRLKREHHGFAIGAFAVILASCSAAGPGSGEPVGQTSEAVVDGVDSTTAQNFVVLVEHKVSCNVTGCVVDECSGSLVAPNLVLTARHCVSNTADSAFTCDASGNGSSGGAIGADFDPSSIAIFVGTNRDVDVSTPDAVGTRLFHDDATNLCNHDVALIGLSTSLMGVPTVALRLATPPVDGDAITAVGWGATTTSNTPMTRQQRSNIPIENVGPYTATNGEDVPPSEFDVGESICQGDSGSPALDGTNAIVGVASRGGNNLVPNPNDLGAGCVGGSSVNYYSQVAAFKDVIEGAFSAMGQKPQLETGGVFGDSCSAPSDCSSDVCTGSGMAAYCSQACDPKASSPCPSGYSCDTVSGQNVCQEGGGCSIGRASSGRRGLWVFATGIALAVGRRRRRSRASLR
jgi:hypothetical protein